MPIEQADSLKLADVQNLIREMYSQKDAARGVEGTFMWLMEEVGELSAALRENDKPVLAAEFADVLAWLATLANVTGIDLETAFQNKYGQGCPGCGQSPCVCQVKP
jgi:NTP pyrophosphatase (non-canonical NTP hydrolase)